MLDFMTVSLADILDIAMVALLIFFVFKWMRGSSAINVLIVVISFYVLRVLASSLGMKMMTTLMDMVLNLGLLALVVIFQPEVRRFLINFGKRYRHFRSGGFFGFFENGGHSLNNEVITEICEACRVMSFERVGALIVVTHKELLQDIVENGDVIDAKVSRRLIRNLFFKNSPMHDGAVIITDNRIVAARCTLPNTQREDIPPQYGMRHKAAIGLSEQSDASVVVVSEETGAISFISDGSLTETASINQLRLMLEKAYYGED